MNSIFLFFLFLFIFINYSLQSYLNDNSRGLSFLKKENDIEDFQNINNHIEQHQDFLQNNQNELQNNKNIIKKDVDSTQNIHEVGLTTGPIHSFLIFLSFLAYFANALFLIYIFILSK